MPKFTIAIPTYNRASLLPGAIESALGQSHDDVEVIVSDNASTDDTPAVVRCFGDRVRYVRNETNVGPLENFCRVVAHATGEYFSWLQDDDCVVASFAERAVRSFQAFPTATAYGAYAAVGASLHDLANAWLYGPPLALDWMTGQSRLISGDLIAPLSLAASVAIPPVVAYRTAVLKDYIPRCNRSIPLYVERTNLASIAAQGDVVFEPYVAGVFRLHAEQAYQLMQREDGAKERQWLEMARDLDAIAARRNESERSSLAARLLEILAEANADHLRKWERESRDWPTNLALCNQMRQALLQLAPVTKEPRSKKASSRLVRAGRRVARALFPRLAG